LDPSSSCVLFEGVQLELVGCMKLAGHTCIVEAAHKQLDFHPGMVGSSPSLSVWVLLVHEAVETLMVLPRNQIRNTSLTTSYSSPSCDQIPTRRFHACEMDACPPCMIFLDDPTRIRSIFSTRTFLAAGLTLRSHFRSDSVFWSSFWVCSCDHPIQARSTSWPLSSLGHACLLPSHYRSISC
jgi:hypothetical protein